MKISEKSGYIIVTAIITAVIVWTLCKDDFSVDRAYLDEIQQKLEEKEETIAELESNETNNIEEQLEDIEDDLSDIYSMVEDVYLKIIPESERQPIFDSFTE